MRRLLFLAALLLAALPAAAQPEGFVLVEAGLHTPLYTSPSKPGPERVEAFFLGATAVTNAEFLAFVRANPEWRRSRAKRVFADAGYLSHWAGDLEPGPGALPDRPVVNVSWFAARAYAAWRGARLPTTAEWERAASASETRRDGREEPGHTQRILAWYSRPGSEPLPPVRSVYRNVWGAYDLHGLVWEWVEDFNSAFVTGDSRSNANFDKGLFCGSGALGASDFRDYAAFMRFAFRTGLEAAHTIPSLGFRIAMDAPDA